MTPAGFIAAIAGWYTAETGRQPWVIWGILRTADAVSRLCRVEALLSTLIAFVLIYALFIMAFLIFTFRMIRRGPEAAPDHAEASGSLTNALRTQVKDYASASHQGGRE